MSPSLEDEPRPGVLKKTVDVLIDIAEGKDVTQLVATLWYLQETDGDVTRDTLQDAFEGSLPDREALRLIRHLRQYNYIGPDALPARTEAIRRLDTYAKLLQMEMTPNETSLLATIPDDPAIRTDGFNALLTELLELIKRAETELWLVSPFLSEEAFERLQPVLRTAADRGATIFLITRYLTYGGDDSHFNREFVRGVLQDEKIVPHTKLFEYVNDETWETFHAKVVIADRKEAYLGTANVTGKGLLTNLELGVQFRGDTVNGLADLFTSLRESEYLHEVEYVGEEFLRVEP